MLDIGIVQNPMFGSGTPSAWGAWLPGYGPGRVIIDGAFADEFHAWTELALGLAWSVVLGAATVVVLARSVNPARRGSAGSPAAHSAR